jgi:hypothetical protein
MSGAISHLVKDEACSLVPESDSRDWLNRFSYAAYFYEGTVAMVFIPCSRPCLNFGGAEPYYELWRRPNRLRSLAFHSGNFDRLHRQQSEALKSSKTTPI